MWFEGGGLRGLWRGDMSSQQQQQQDTTVEIQDSQPPSAESQQLIGLFTDMEQKQIDFLNESGKSLIERISTFLAILLGLSVLSNNFPPTYLKGNLLARVLVILILLCYFLAMLAAMWAIQPRFYRRYLHNVSGLGRERDKITRHKMRWLRIASVLFLLGSLALAFLIATIVWKITA